MSVSLSIVRTLPELDALEAHWHALHALDDSAGIFNSWYWNRLWWQHYGSNAQLHVLVFRNDAEVVGIVPLYCSVSRLYRLIPVRTVRWIGCGGDTSPEDLDMLCHSAWRGAVLQRIVNHLLAGAAGERLYLSDMRSDSALLRALDNALATGAGYRREVVRHPLRYAVLPASWEEFRLSLSRNTRKRIKARKNRLQQVASGEITVSKNAAERRDAFEALVRLHHARRPDQQAPRGFATQAYCNFHDELQQSLLASNQLWLVTLKIDRQIVAVEYAYRCKHVLSFFQTGFDPAYEALSPGHVLMTWMVEQAFDAGVERIELLRGDYPYKASYAKGVRYSETVDSLLPGWRARLRAAVERVRKWAEYLPGWPALVTRK